MHAIEPNLGALLVFAVAVAVASTGLYVLSGTLPLETRPDLDRPLGIGLIVIDGLLLLALAGWSLAYGVNNLRWTSLVIVAGLCLLFAPGLFNNWPARWRDGTVGLVVVLAAYGAALTMLAAASQHLRI